MPQELIDRFGSARMNMFPVLEKLAKKSKEQVVVEGANDRKAINKKKWGVVVATTRMNTRNHGVVNVMDKVKEYQKRKNGDSTMFQR
jgi:hypothetical protein